MRKICAFSENKISNNLDSIKKAMSKWDLGSGTLEKYTMTGSQLNALNATLKSVELALPDKYTFECRLFCRRKPRDRTILTSPLILMIDTENFLLVRGAKTPGGHSFGHHFLSRIGTCFHYPRVVFRSDLKDIPKDNWPQDYEDIKKAINPTNIYKVIDIDMRSAGGWNHNIELVKSYESNNNVIAIIDYSREFDAMGGYTMIFLKPDIN